MNNQPHSIMLGAELEKIDPDTSCREVARVVALWLDNTGLILHALLVSLGNGSFHHIHLTNNKEWTLVHLDEHFNNHQGHGKDNG